MLNQSQETVDDFGPRLSNDILSNGMGRLQVGFVGSRNMGRHCLKLLVVVLAAFAVLAQVRSAAGQYRGAPAGWPQNAGGYYASYPVSGSGQPYYVARPVMPAQRPAAIAYVPVNAAYANPNYFGAYATTRAGYRPQAAAVAYNGQAAAYYPPATTAYYPQSPAGANYAPSSGYAISPAGSSYAGAEAAAYLGQPTTVNYMPPRVTYRPAYAATPVYAYQPVVAYQVGVQPTTCGQPVAVQPVATGCGAAKSCRRGFLSFLNPFNWFRRGGCGAAPTTAYCGAATNCYSVAQCGTTTGCGQPYYPTQPMTIIPTVPAPANTIPSIRSPIIGTPTVPPPPTRSNPSTFVPADSAPSVAPGTIIRPGTTTPGSGGSFTPSGGFGTPPAGTPGGSFPSGSNYAPEEDPYAEPTISGANYRSQPTSPSTIREPGASDSPTRQLAPSVRPIPDPDAREKSESPSRAPQLLDPRDKSASTRFNRWAVVPAVWPTKSAGGRLATFSREEASPYLSPQSANEPAHAYEPVKHFVPAAEPQYDDGGWSSGR
jgi:hypothetical protein